MERISGFLSHMSFADIFIAIIALSIFFLWCVLTAEEAVYRKKRGHRS